MRVGTPCRVSAGVRAGSLAANSIACFAAVRSGRRVRESLSLRCAARQAGPPPVFGPAVRMAERRRGSGRSTYRFPCGLSGNSGRHPPATTGRRPKAALCSAGHERCRRGPDPSDEAIGPSTWRAWGSAGSAVVPPASAPLGGGTCSPSRRPLGAARHVGALMARQRKRRAHKAGLRRLGGP